MRPRRLELAGFASFRHPTTLELEGDGEPIQLFAIAGPTGAGKSSLIDAITFALYGSVPRLEDQRLVAPVITQGMQEARVRFDFGLEGKTYTAVRVVRRTVDGGATTREARLECDGEVIAGTAAEVTAQVTELLGLEFEHFTKCVVLPQGAFQRFLHDKPADRQELLVKLLDLGVLGRMRQLATQRVRRAEGEVTILEQRLASDLADATVEAVAAAASRLEQLEGLGERLASAAIELDELSRAVEAAGQEASAVAERVARLAAVHSPAGVETLAAETRQAAALEAASRVEVEAADEALQVAESTVAELPLAGLLERYRDRWQRLERIRQRRSVSAPQLAAVRLEEERLAAALAETAAARQAAATRLEELRRAEAAAHLRSTIQSGDPCPVCGATVGERHWAPPPASVREAEEDLREADQAVLGVGGEARRVEQERARLDGETSSFDAEIAELEKELVEAPALGEVDGLMARRVAADECVAQARRRQQEAWGAATAARLEHQQAEGRTVDAWKELGATRDALAAMTPPSLSRQDLSLAWGTLSAWAGQRLPQEQRAHHEVTRRREESERQLGALRAALLEEAASIGVEADDDRLQIAVAGATARARAAHDALVAALAQAEASRRRIAESRAEAERAQHLARHLSSRGFESWALGRAFDRLLSGASHLLRGLSSNLYSLSADERSGQLLVIDHGNADERRLVRTLSGGETFLASLALALALAEDVAQLAARGSARLEALFLDEGFGALDPESLETVAAALEELGARGRMVGVVTHVRELAERLPIRYEVRKGSGGSVVEKVVT